MSTNNRWSVFHLLSMFYYVERENNNSVFPFFLSFFIKFDNHFFDRNLNKFRFVKHSHCNKNMELRNW